MLNLDFRPRSSFFHVGILQLLKYVIAYGATAVIFFAVDFVWLGVMAKSFYRDHIGHLMADQVNMTAAVGFYLLYIVGIVVFAVLPALHSDSWKTALLLGGLLGLIAYGTYDMTNLATLRDWPVAVAVVDMAWGTALPATSATAGYFISRMFSQ
jgi:uncharacterized membrane protein